VNVFKTEKIIGYVLLALGVILLIFSIFEMVNVYYGYTPPPKLFDIGDISLPLGETGSSVSLIQGTQVSQLPNLFFWFILMGFVLLAGGKIASLGVSMIKDIKVEIKEPISAPPETKST
jgi:hypothetical protein